MNTSDRIDRRLVVEQAEREFQLLDAIARELVSIIQPDGSANNRSDILEKVRIGTASLLRHVERVFAIEEEDGYMVSLAETHPELLHRIDRLRNEHEALRDSLEKVVTSLQSVPDNDEFAPQTIYTMLLEILQRLDRHTHAESQLLEDAYLQDTGGEGGC